MRGGGSSFNVKLSGTAFDTSMGSWPEIKPLSCKRIDKYSLVVCHMWLRNVDCAQHPLFLHDVAIWPSQEVNVFTIGPTSAIIHMLPLCLSFTVSIF